MEQEDGRASSLPRMMEVSDDEDFNSFNVQKVFYYNSDFDYPFIAVTGGIDLNGKMDMNPWKYAREITPAPETDDREELKKMINSFVDQVIDYIKK